MAKKIFLSTVLLTGLFLFSGLQSAATGSLVVDRVVAVVNGEIITLSDLQREETLNKKKEPKLDTRHILEDMIDRKLQMTAAKRAGMDVTDKELSEAVSDIEKRNNMDTRQFEAALAKEGLTLEQYKSDLKEQMTLSRVFNKFVRAGIAVDEAEARAFYQKNLKVYSLPEEIRVRQIFIPAPEKAKADKIAAAKEKAQALYERAKKGEDFIGLVREGSEGVTAQHDGDLGFMQRDQVIPEIAAAIQNLQPGEIAKPFLGAGGYNVILLEETRSPIKPFESVKEEILNILYQQKLDNSYRNWLQTLRSDSHIENKL